MSIAAGNLKIQIFFAEVEHQGHLRQAAHGDRGVQEEHDAERALQRREGPEQVHDAVEKWADAQRRLSIAPPEYPLFTLPPML